MTHKLRRHYTFPLALLFAAICFIALAFGVTSPSQAVNRSGDEQAAAAVHE